MFLKRIFNIGNYKSLSEKESKQVILLNKMAVMGVFFLLCMVFVTILAGEKKKFNIFFLLSAPLKLYFCILFSSGTVCDGISLHGFFWV